MLLPFKLSTSEFSHPQPPSPSQPLPQDPNKFPALESPDSLAVPSTLLVPRSWEVSLAHGPMVQSPTPLSTSELSARVSSDLAWLENTSTLRERSSPVRLLGLRKESSFLLAAKLLLTLLTPLDQEEESSPWSMFSKRNTVKQEDFFSLLM